MTYFDKVTNRIGLGLISQKLNFVEVYGLALYIVVNFINRKFNHPGKMLCRCLFSHLLLLLLHIQYSASSAPVLDFIPEQEDQNMILLECLGNDGQASTDALFEFYEPVSGSLRNSAVPNVGNPPSARAFSVTPQSEAIIRCRINNGPPSQNVSIAGKLLSSIRCGWKRHSDQWTQNVKTFVNKMGSQNFEIKK